MVSVDVKHHVYLLMVYQDGGRKAGWGGGVENETHVHRCVLTVPDFYRFTSVVTTDIDFRSCQRGLRDVCGVRNSEGQRQMEVIHPCLVDIYVKCRGRDRQTETETESDRDKRGREEKNFYKDCS